MSAISAGGCTLVAELFSPSPQYGLMQHSPSEIKEKLLKALDKEYNVVDMATVVEIISILERTVITKEALETTRLGKYVNELRRKTKDELLAKRAKDLVRRWRVMIQENNSGGSGSMQSQTNGAGSGTMPPCKPKVPEVSLLINNAAPTGNVRQLNHPAAPEDSYNAWKWRQSNMIETKNNNRPIQHSLKQLDPPLPNSTRACYSDTKHADERYGTVTENWHFSPGTQLYTPIGESTPLQGILRNSGRNAVMYDKTSHRVSYQPGKPLTEGSYPDVNTCLNSSNQMSHRSYGSSNHMHANQENVMFHRVPVSRNHSNQLQIPEYNCYTDQRQWELKEKQHPAPGGMHPPGSCCGSHVPSGDMYNGCSNDEDPKCNRVSENLTKPQSCCSNASRNCCISNVEVHNDNKKTPKGGRVKETLEPQPQLLPALFRLVCMQNEQLQQLKEQVQKLVQKLETSAQPAKVCMQNVAVQSENVCSCYQQKVSVGVMVAVAEEQEVHVKANRFEQQQQLVPVATSSCQSCQKSTPAVDETINFSSMQLPTVHEPAPSPMTTMHVDMHDYQSDDEHGDVGARASPWHGNDGRHKDQHQQAEDGDRIHWTCYSNVMVVDMATVAEIISILERTVITKEALETTRLGKYVNELRRKTKDELLAKRAKDLVRRWRVMIQENNSGGSGSMQSQTNGAGSGTMVSPALRSVVSPGLVYRSNVSPSLPTVSSLPYGSNKYVRGATVSPAVSLPSSDKSTSPGLSILSSSRLAPMPPNASRSRPSTPQQLQSKALMPHSPSLQSNSVLITDPVPKTHASNKRLRKDAFPSDCTSAPPPKKIARPNGQVMSVMGSRKTLAVSPPDFHGECSRDSFGGLSQGSSGCEIVCTVTATASQNKVPLSEPVKTASQLKQGKKKHSKVVDKLSLVNASAVHVPSGDDIVMQKIESKVRTPKVKTTQELVASVQAKTGSIGAREGGSELPENKPSLSNSMFSCRGTATDALEISQNKTEHIAKFLQSQSELEPVPDVLSLPVHSEPAISTDGFDGPSTISSQSAGPPVACDTQDRTIEDLAKLPPIDPDSINWDESVDNSEESIESPKVITEEDIERLRTSCIEGVNGNWNDGVKVPDANDNFREWHETLSKVSYQGELLHILPYVIID